jgi:hypothetical protein
MELHTKVINNPEKGTIGFDRKKELSKYMLHLEVDIHKISGSSLLK